MGYDLSHTHTIYSTRILLCKCALRGYPGALALGSVDLPRASVDLPMGNVDSLTTNVDLLGVNVDLLSRTGYRPLRTVIFQGLHSDSGESALVGNQLRTHYALLRTHYALLRTRYALLRTRYALLRTHYALRSAGYITNSCRALFA